MVMINFNHFDMYVCPSIFSSLQDKAIEFARLCVDIKNMKLDFIRYGSELFLFS